MNRCLVCNIEIPNTRKYCSDKCKEKYRYNNTLIKKTCSICGKKFIGKRGKSTCSEKCFLKSQRTYYKICPVCKKGFSARGNGIYCSDSCYRLANNNKKGFKIKNCLVCNKEFKTLSENEKLTCSHKCDTKLVSTLIEGSYMAVFNTIDTNTIRKLMIDRGQYNEN